MSSIEQPVFIVGAPRSGTTLLAATLATHSRLSCGPETHFFRFLSKIDTSWLCDPHSWPDNAVDFLYSNKNAGQPIPESYGVRRRQIYSYLRARRPGVPVILRALTEIDMKNKGKYRWVEKTPNHTIHVHEIRKYFPHAPIIRIMRDPRDVALSIINAPWEWAPRSFTEALMLWYSYDEQSSDFFRQDKNCYTVYYESLVNSPERELQQLCNFIGEVYEPSMLEMSRSAEDVITENEIAWKRKVHNPIDKTRAHVWRNELSVGQNRLAEALIGDRLQVYGYETLEHFEYRAFVYPSLDVLAKYPRALTAIVASSVRFWCKSEHETDRIVVFGGEPDRDRWLGSNKLVRSLSIARIAFYVLRGKMANKPVYWIREEKPNARFGYSSRVLSLLFRFAARQILT